MLDLVELHRKGVGRQSDTASASGSLNARLAELLARFTTTIVGRIDVAVSSRIQSSAYTAARAAFLDRIGLVSLQFGTVTIASGATSGTATISSVNTAKAHAVYLGHGTSESSCSSTCHVQDEADCKPRVELTNATTVTAFRPSSHNGNRVIAFMVPEYRSP